MPALRAPRTAGEAGRGLSGTTGKGSQSHLIPIFAASAYVLSALVPLLVLLEVPESGRTDAWVATLVVAVWAGLRLSFRIASGAPRLFDFVFWLFTYIFMGLAPTIQIRSGDIPRTTPGIPPDLEAPAATAVWVGIFAYEIGFLSAHLRRRAKRAPLVGGRMNVISEYDGLSGARALILAAIGFASAIYMVQAIGLPTLFLTRNASFKVREIAVPDSALLATIEAAASVPLLIAAGTFILLRRSTPPGRVRDRLYLGILVTVLPLIIIVNPISSARYKFGMIAFALLVLAGAMSSLPRSRASMIGIVAAFLFVFPIADAFRTEVVGIERKGFFGEYAGNPDYDAFWQVANSLAYLRDAGLNIGQQFTGTLLFWVPRSIWPSKPVDTGIVLAEFRGYDYTNLSAPLWSELLMNGAWVALILGFSAFGLLAYRLDNRVAAALVQGGQFLSLVGAVFPFLMVILLRGSLLQATGTFALAVGGVVFVRQRNRPFASGRLMSPERTVKA